MKKSIIPLIIATSLLVACNDKEHNELSNKLKQSEILVAQLQNQVKQLQEEAQTFPSLQVKIYPLFNKNKTIKFNNNEFISEGTIDISVNIPETGIEWLDSLFIEKLYRENNKGNSEKLTDKPTKKILLQQFENIYSEFVKEMNEYPVIEYSYEKTFEYIGQRNNIITFLDSTYYFGGGAHGIYHLNYFSIDTNKRTIISLSDIVSKKEQEKLKNILWQNYIDNHSDENKETFTSQEDFYISESFYFTMEGIKFVYPPYALGPYAAGDITLTAYWEPNLINTEYKW